MTIPLITITAKSGSGKTTLMENLIAEIKSRGYRLATIKHHSHSGFEIDKPGKDSWRFKQAGSDYVIIAAPDKIAQYRMLDRELTLDENHCRNPRPSTSSWQKDTNVPANRQLKSYARKWGWN